MHAFESAVSHKSMDVTLKQNNNCTREGGYWEIWQLDPVISSKVRNASAYGLLAVGGGA